jgi:serine/threonine protein kinase
VRSVATCCRYRVQGASAVRARVVVLKARHIHTDDTVAIKLHSSHEQWSREVEAYRVLKHRTCVARLEDSFPGTDTSPPSIVLEWGIMSLSTWCKENAGVKYKVKAVLTQVGASFHAVPAAWVTPFIC